MSAANSRRRPKIIQKQGEQALTKAQLHLLRQRNAYRVLEKLRQQAEYNPFAQADLAALKDGEDDLCWVAYLAKSLKLSEADIKRALKSLEQFNYIRCLAGFVGAIKLLEKSVKVKGRVNIGGGYCGHDNDNPTIELARRVNITKSYPKLITRAMSRMEKYYSRPSLFPSLMYCQPHKKRKTKRGVSRRQYSQRRYACVVVLAALLKRMDIKTLKILVSDSDGNFYDCKVSVLVNDTGLHPRRVERALADIKDAGLVKVLARPVEKDEQGKFTAMPAVRSFNESFFGVLGMHSWLKKEQANKKEKEVKKQKKLIKQQKEAESKPNLSAQHRSKLFFDANRNRQIKQQQQLFNTGQQQQKKQNEHEQLAHKKQYLGKVSELYSAYQGKKSIEEIKQLARQLTGYTGD